MLLPKKKGKTAISKQQSWIVLQAGFYYSMYTFCQKNDIVIDIDVLVTKNGKKRKKKKK